MVLPFSESFKRTSARFRRQNFTEKASLPYVRRVQSGVTRVAELQPPTLPRPPGTETLAEAFLGTDGARRAFRQAVLVALWTGVVSSDSEGTDGLCGGD